MGVQARNFLPVFIPIIAHKRISGFIEEKVRNISQGFMHGEARITFSDFISFITRTFLLEFKEVKARMPSLGFI